MKSLAELNAIKEKMKSNISVRKDGSEGTKIVVGMATCGIAAGARPVLMALTEEVNKLNLDGVSVAQAGCIGICQYEPVVEIFEPGKEKVTYVRMTAEKAREIVSKHIKGGKIIAEYTIGSVSTSK